MADGAYDLLDESIRRYIWTEQWESLRDVQERSIPVIVRGERDAIIAAATAAGKTEAAFLPALTHSLSQPRPSLIIYISPLKALINDQFDRLSRLCESLGIPVWPWHGDVAASTKARFRRNPCGVLLITPESLEAMLCNRGTATVAFFAETSFFVVDELHAFIGSERGKQLQSLMHRIELAVQRRITRVGLSATLGDMRLAAEYLRPGAGATVAIVDSKEAGGELQIGVRGFLEPLESSTNAHAADDDLDELAGVAPRGVAEHLFKVLRGTNNLVFPNSRAEVERYTFLLNSICDANHVSQEFWPHHGSLSKDAREEAETALKRRDRAATAICTSTLELGIDIGPVRSVCQVGPPSSVASMRQRLGRSGRRKNEPKILRGYCIEQTPEKGASLTTVLRLRTVQMIAAIELLLEGWFEPPPAGGLHLSTLVQQLLSSIAQHHGMPLSTLHQILCAPGAPFENVSKGELVVLMRNLGAKKMITQDASGDIHLGEVGEREVAHYSFYASFPAEEEFTVIASGRHLGTLPVATLVAEGQGLLFRGKRWRIERIDHENSVLHVVKTRGGVTPMFTGGAARVHGTIRGRMKALLESDSTPAYLDGACVSFLTQAREAYAEHITHDGLFDGGTHWLLLTWMGDAGNEAFACCLSFLGWPAAVVGPAVEIQKGGRERGALWEAVRKVSESDFLLEDLLPSTEQLAREKWDHLLPDVLLRKTYFAQHLDLVEALRWARAAVNAGRTSASQIEPLA